ncbi:MAG: hypothetical protein NZ529_08100 [Cytophagaceae bacterium]|nr:hypothetical protein [Cytophagaceae bacterium]MDW8456744.1 hypothetical protein [Cytophagaceae bacterium]
MICICDSGSSKALWGFIENTNAPRYIYSAGINPATMSEDEIHTSIQSAMDEFSDCYQHVHEVCFYGAGCSTTAAKSKVENALKKIFCKSCISVQSDLLGAARSLFGNQKGIACILGTGSNSCLYDGKDITENVPSLGYILGDEGSGTAIGKKLLSDYLRGLMPADIQIAFEEYTPDRYADIIDNVYNNSIPNRYIASFAKFAAKFKHHKYIQNTLRVMFEQFISTHVLRYSMYNALPVRFTGSVAYHFQDILRETAKNYELNVDLITEHPMPGLIKYHGKSE